MGKEILSNVEINKDGSITIGKGVDAIKIKGSNLAITEPATKVAGNYPDMYPWDGSTIVYPIEDIDTGLDPTYPPDNVPVARLPKVIRDLKVGAVVTTTIPAVFYEGVANGDLVTLDTETMNWKVASVPENVTPSDPVEEVDQIFYGIANTTSNSVQVSAVINCKDWNLEVGQAYYLDKDNPGKVSTVDSGVFVGYALGSSTMFFAPMANRFDRWADRLRAIAKEAEEKLTKKLAEVDAAIVAADERITALDEEVNRQIAQAIADLQAEFKAADEVLKDFVVAEDKKISDRLDEAIAALNKAIADGDDLVMAELAEAKAELEAKLATIVAQHTQDVTDIRTTMANNKTELQTAITAVESSLAEYKTEVAQKFTDVSERFDEVAANFTTVNSSITNLTNAVTTINSTIDGIQEKITTIETNTEGVTKDALEGLSTRIGAAETDIDAVEAEIATVKATAGTNKTDVEKLKTDVGAAVTDIEAIDTRVTTLEVEMDTAQADIEALKAGGGGEVAIPSNVIRSSNTSLQVSVDSESGVDTSVESGYIIGESGKPGSLEAPFKTVGFAMAEANKFLLTASGNKYAVKISLKKGGTYPLADNSIKCVNPLEVSAYGEGASPIVTPFEGKELYFGGYGRVDVQDITVQAYLICDEAIKYKLTNIACVGINAIGARVEIGGETILGVTGLVSGPEGMITCVNGAFVSVSGTSLTTPAFIRVFDLHNRSTCICHLKDDQIHLEETPAACWAKNGSFMQFTSASGSIFGNKEGEVSSDSTLVFMAG